MRPFHFREKSQCSLACNAIDAHLWYLIRAYVCGQYAQAYTRNYSVARLVDELWLGSALQHARGADAYSMAMANGYGYGTPGLSFALHW